MRRCEDPWQKLFGGNQRERGFRPARRGDFSNCFCFDVGGGNVGRFEPLETLRSSDKWHSGNLALLAGERPRRVATMTERPAIVRVEPELGKMSELFDVVDVGRLAASAIPTNDVVRLTQKPGAKATPMRIVSTSRRSAAMLVILSAELCASRLVARAKSACDNRRTSGSRAWFSGKSQGILLRLENEKGVPNEKDAFLGKHTESNRN